MNPALPRPYLNETPVFPFLDNIFSFWIYKIDSKSENMFNILLFYVQDFPHTPPHTQTHPLKKEDLED